MNYSEFTDFCIDFAWREGDLDLAAKIDNIITMANSDLRAALNVKERETILDTTLEASTYALGDDVLAVKHVLTPLGEHRKVTLGELNEYAAKYGADAYHKIYARTANRLTFLGPYEAAFDAGNGVALTLVYTSKIPDFKVTDESWLTSENLAIYVYAVMKHACVYLREMDQLQVWVGLLNEAIERANDHDAWHREEGLQPPIVLPHLT